MLELSFVLSALLAGFLTFLAPCTLPLIPGYLAFISGTSLKDLSNPEKRSKARLKIFINGVFYVLGFSLVFVIMGSLAGFIGESLASYRQWLIRIGGVFVILFGLFMMRAIKIPFLSKETNFKAPKFFKEGNYTNSFALGASFAFGWTPCIGPVLGSILTLASTSATVASGALMLAVFSLGLGIPFLLIAIGVGSASKYINKISKYLNVISIIGGIFLVILGILLLTNNMSLIISYGFQFFDFLNYDALLKFL